MNSQNIKELSEANLNELTLHILDIKKDIAYIKENMDCQNEKWEKQESLNKKFIQLIDNIDLLTKLFMFGGGSSLLSYLLYLYLSNLYR